MIRGQLYAVMYERLSKDRRGPKLERLRKPRENSSVSQFYPLTNTQGGFTKCKLADRRDGKLAKRDRFSVMELRLA